MSEWIAALPMYDWPELRSEADASWARLRLDLRKHGIDAPDSLVRRNADLPPVPGGIRDRAGTMLAPDPASLPPDGLDLQTLWLHPALLLAQTCWGPMGLGLEQRVFVVGQPDYSGFEGGDGEYYSSAIVMRGPSDFQDIAPLPDGQPILPLHLMRGQRLAYNSAESMSGILALERDVEVTGESLELFSRSLKTGSHRASLMAVAQGKADIAAIDCRSWSLFKRFEARLSGRLQVVGWTARRKGLPFIAGEAVPEEDQLLIREALYSLGMTVAAKTTG